MKTPSSLRVLMNGAPALGLSSHPDFLNAANHLLQPQVVDLLVAPRKLAEESSVVATPVLNVVETVAVKASSLNQSQLGSTSAEIRRLNLKDFRAGISSRAPGPEPDSIRY